MNITRRNDHTTAYLLIGLGVLALLGTMGAFRFLGDVFGALLLGGLAYLAYTEGGRRGSAWRLAAFPLAGLAVAAIAPARLGGGAFLGGLGLAFAVHWYEDKTRWWALIPAGTFASLGVTAFFEGLLGASAGWIFPIGLAATFFALTRLPVDPQPWAVWPAGGLVLLALLGVTTGGGWVMPLLLVAVGVLLLVRRQRA